MDSGIHKANLQIAHDLSVGDWIRDGLAPWVLFSETPVTIGIVIPKGFESYLLIQHTHEGDWMGNLGSESLTKLITVLTKFTSTPHDCYIALWEGNGWTNPGAFAYYVPVKFPKLHHFRMKYFRSLRFHFFSRRKFVRRPTNVQNPPNTLPEGIIDAPRFTLPNRGYLLTKGPIEESNNLGWYPGEFLHRQAPNLLWPADRHWILATEIDFNVTLLAGSEEMISAIENLDFFTTQRFKVTDAIADLPIVEH